MWLPEEPERNEELPEQLVRLTHERAALERAAQLEPFNPATRYRLGLLYRELGRQEDAHRELAEFEKLKKMKNRLSERYQQMRLSPGKPDDSGAPTSP